MDPIELARKLREENPHCWEYSNQDVFILAREVLRLDCELRKLPVKEEA